MMSSSGRSSSSSNVYPFTTSQWQELEHQALVFKYIISGLQIPQDLLFTIRTSLHDSKLLLHHPPPPPIGWNGYHHQQQQQMGMGYHHHQHHRKIDAEPGRCRRTDGKKWRCSREAYTDSKYCERHMHRGRNRSRKPVENILLSSPPPPPPTTKPSTNSNTNTAIPTTINTNAHHSSSAQSHFPYSHNTPPSSSVIPFPSSSQQCSTKFFMESNPYRNSHGRETDNEHRFLSSEINSSNGGVNDSSSLKMGSSALFQMKENSSAYTSSGLENWQQQLQSLTRQQNHHSYNSYSSYDHHMRPPLSTDDGEEADHHQQHHTKKVMHHFLDSWPDSEDHLHHKSVPPNSLHDFFMTEKW